MGKVPVCSGREPVKAFGHLGWQNNLQSGSHIILVKPGASTVLSVPDHHQLDRGTLRSLIRLSGASVDAFSEALKS